MILNIIFGSKTKNERSQMGPGLTIRGNLDWSFLLRDDSICETGELGIQTLGTGFYNK